MPRAVTHRARGHRPAHLTGQTLHVPHGGRERRWQVLHTPSLLEHIQQATGGASLEANICAVTGNVRLAGDIAHAWAERSRSRA